ncbi:hypothetical protein KFL_000170090 [Klebsormidium nitens]|uniref:Fungal lipase-type domain-containing protein n=1 Tax=Klebsormidium nitens TaxID=105231 RepID=A0A1Y1HL19_KLENI|nr:hypothetical protein KFL_000170090 [Klebsormidium nitens]|eukprot:GAQ78663.1 hypothetical protein KFL_000170090 [Klebsormidium nitens]
MLRASVKGFKPRDIGQPNRLRASSGAVPIYEPGWTALRGKHDWKGMVPKDPESFMDKALKKEVTLYGEAAEATYDTVDLRDWSRDRDRNRFPKERLLDDGHLIHESFFAELPGKGYSAEKGAFLIASEKAQITKDLIKERKGQDVEDNVWIGYVAYSAARKDVLVAWRGTQRPAEWISDATLDQIPYLAYPKEPNPSNPPPRPKKLSVLQKLSPLFIAVLWASPLLLFLAVKSGPANFPRALVSFATAFESQVAAPSSGYPATAAVVLWAAIPLAFRRLGYSFLAGGAATLLGIVTLVPPAAIIYAIGRLLPAFQAGGVVSLLATAPLAFLAAIPALELFNVRDRNGYRFYALIAACASVAVSVWYPGSFYRAVGVIMAFVFVPLAVTSGQAAWAGAAETGPCVHEGFFELYSKPPVKPENDAVERSAPRDTLHKAVKALLEDASIEVETISVSGHSLGAALAVVSAFDLVKSGTNETTVGGRLVRVPVTCFSFEGPRVGNVLFAEDFARLKAQGLTAIRVVNKPDVVTQVPKALFLQNVYFMLGAVLNMNLFCSLINWFENVSYGLRLPSAYKHVGVEIPMDSRQVDYIQQMKGRNPLGNSKQISSYHNLECCLHVLSGFSEAPKPFGAAFSRDFALVNKIGNVLNPRFGISPNWLDTLTPNVTRADPGGAIIQPYADPVKIEYAPVTDEVKLERSDNKRKIGHGPGKEPWPLCKDFIARYMSKKEA